MTPLKKSTMVAAGLKPAKIQLLIYNELYAT